MRTFDQIYVLDLHGNSKKKERAPDGSRDENVFDIEQGVAISLCVKKPGLERGVWRGDLWGKRLEKYGALARESSMGLTGEEISPSGPYYLFERSDEERRQEFDAFWSISEIFPLGVTGIVTARDRLVSAHSDKDLRKKITDFLDQSISDSEIRRRYSVGDNYQWKLSSIRLSMKDESFDKDRLGEILHHPFDIRRIYNDDRLVFRPRTSVMSLLVDGNIGLVTTRMTKDDGCVFCVDTPIGHKAASSYDLSYVYPLRISGGVENLSPAVRSFLDDCYHHHYTPEEFIGFVYAVLYAPTYRRRYAELLRIDFPRVPFPKSLCRSSDGSWSKLIF